MMILGRPGHNVIHLPRQHLWRVRAFLLKTDDFVLKNDAFVLTR